MLGEVGQEGRVAGRSLGCLIWGQLHSCLGVCKDAERFKIHCVLVSLSSREEARRSQGLGGIFPGGPAAKTLRSQHREAGFDLWSGNWISTDHN